MNRQQREKVNRIVEALLDMKSEHRPGALEALCAGLDAAVDSAAVRAEVTRLLSEDDQVTAKLATLIPATLASDPTRNDRTTNSATLGSSIERVPPIIGRYHIRSPLGKGGMGEVFLAEQRSPIRRSVALKLIRGGFHSHDIVTRFEAERQALSRMDHPNIARVLDAGITDSGMPYFVMEYVPGSPVTAFADEHNLSIAKRLTLFTQVCDAIAHAHTKGVIHRDLKPSNVLALMGDDGAPTVKVIDFGVAKALGKDQELRLGTSTIHTMVGLVVGTYEYMSPEQAAGSADIDTRADVYSLGVLLYELLTGLRPFERADLVQGADDELRRVIREVDPPRPSLRIRSLKRPRSTTINEVSAEPTASAPTTLSIARTRDTEPRALVRMLQKELEWIPLMALRKERQRRYSGPAEMAADVRNYLEGRPLRAAPESRFYRAKKFIARHRASIAGASLLLTLLIAGIVGTSVGLLREKAARVRANQSEARSTWSAYRSAIAAADVALANGDSIRLRQALEVAKQGPRGWEWDRLAHAAAASSATLHSDRDERYIFTLPLADNRRAISCTGARAGTSVLWDISTGAVIRRNAGGFAVPEPTGEQMAIVRPDGTLELIDVNTGTLRWRAEVSSSTNVPWVICENSFSPDGKQLLAWDGQGRALTLFDVRNGIATTVPVGAKVAELTGFIQLDSSVTRPRLVFTSDSALSTLSVDPDTGVTRRESGFAMIYGRHVMLGTTTSELRPLVPDGMPAPAFDITSVGVGGAMVLLPNRQLLGAGREDGSVQMLTPRVTKEGTNGEPLGSAMRVSARRIVVGTAPVRAIACTPNEQRLLVTLLNGDVSVVSVDPPPQVSIAIAGVGGAEASPDATRLLTLGWGDVQCLDTLTGLALWGRNLGPYENRYAAWSPDGRTVVVATSPSPGPGSQTSDVFVLDAQSGEQLAAWSESAVTADAMHPPHAPEWASDVAGLSFDRDGQTLFVARSSGRLVRVDTSSWTLLPDEPQFDANASIGPGVIQQQPMFGSLRRSMNGSSLVQVTTVRDASGKPFAGPVILRDSGNGRVRQVIRRDGMGATSAALSQDGKTLAVGFASPTHAVLAAFDVETGRELWSIDSPGAAAISAIAFNGRRDRVVAVTQTRRLLLADVDTGEEVMSSFHTHPVLAASFTKEDALFLTGGGIALSRIESDDADALLARVLSVWPASVPRPASVDEARRWIGIAQARLARVYNAGENPVDVAATQFAPHDPVRSLFVELASRQPPSVNLLNSGALARMMSSTSGPLDLARGEEMLRQAVAIKPHSYFLQTNFGSILFMQGKHAACVEPLTRAQLIAKQRGLAPSPSLLLRLAIATHALKRADAESFYDDALSLVASQSLADDPEIRPLLEQARADFGR